MKKTHEDLHDYVIAFEDPELHDGRLQVLRPSDNFLLSLMNGEITGKEMSEEAAMEFILKKDVPERVWKNSNSQKFRFMRDNQIPKDRTFRNAWRLA